MGTPYRRITPCSAPPLSVAERDGWIAVVYPESVALFDSNGEPFLQSIPDDRILEGCFVSLVGLPSPAVALRCASGRLLIVTPDDYQPLSSLVRFLVPEAPETFELQHTDTPPGSPCSVLALSDEDAILNGMLSIAGTRRGDLVFVAATDDALITGVCRVTRDGLVPAPEVGFGMIEFDEPPRDVKVGSLPSGHPVLLCGDRLIAVAAETVAISLPQGPYTNIFSGPNGVMVVGQHIARVGPGMFRKAEPVEISFLGGVPRPLPSSTESRLELWPSPEGTIGSLVDAGATMYCVTHRLLRIQSRAGKWEPLQKDSLIGYYPSSPVVLLKKNGVVATLEPYCPNSPTMQLYSYLADQLEPEELAKGVHRLLNKDPDALFPLMMNRASQEQIASCLPPLIQTCPPEHLSLLHDALPTHERGRLRSTLTQAACAVLPKDQPPQPPHLAPCYPDFTDTFDTLMVNRTPATSSASLVALLPERHVTARLRAAFQAVPSLPPIHILSAQLGPDKARQVYAHRILVHLADGEAEPARKLMVEAALGSEFLTSVLRHTSLANTHVTAAALLEISIEADTLTEDVIWSAVLGSKDESCVMTPVEIALETVDITIDSLCTALQSIRENHPLPPILANKPALWLAVCESLPEIADITLTSIDDSELRWQLAAQRWPELSPLGLANRLNVSVPTQFQFLQEPTLPIALSVGFGSTMPPNALSGTTESTGLHLIRQLRPMAAFSADPCLPLEDVLLAIATVISDHPISRSLFEVAVTTADTYWNLRKEPQPELGRVWLGFLAILAARAHRGYASVTKALTNLLPLSITELLTVVHEYLNTAPTTHESWLHFHPILLAGRGDLYHRFCSVMGAQPQSVPYYQVSFSQDDPVEYALAIMRAGSFVTPLPTEDVIAQYLSPHLLNIVPEGVVLDSTGIPCDSLAWLLGSGAEGIEGLFERLGIGVVPKTDDEKHQLVLRLMMEHSFDVFKLATSLLFNPTHPLVFLSHAVDAARAVDAVACETSINQMAEREIDDEFIGELLSSLLAPTHQYLAVPAHRLCFVGALSATELAALLTPVGSKPEEPSARELVEALIDEAQGVPALWRRPGVRVATYERAIRLTLESIGADVNTQVQLSADEVQTLEIVLGPLLEQAKKQQWTTDIQYLSTILEIPTDYPEIDTEEDGDQSAVPFTDEEIHRLLSPNTGTALRWKRAEEHCSEADFPHYLVQALTQRLDAFHRNPTGPPYTDADWQALCDGLSPETRVATALQVCHMDLSALLPVAALQIVSVALRLAIVTHPEASAAVTALTPFLKTYAIKLLQEKKPCAGVGAIAAIPDIDIVRFIFGLHHMDGTLEAFQILESDHPFLMAVVAYLRQFGNSDAQRPLLHALGSLVRHCGLRMENAELLEEQAKQRMEEINYPLTHSDFIVLLRLASKLVDAAEKFRKEQSHGRVVRALSVASLCCLQVRRPLERLLNLETKEVYDLLLRFDLEEALIVAQAYQLPLPGALHQPLFQRVFLQGDLEFLAGFDTHFGSIGGDQMIRLAAMLTLIPSSLIDDDVLSNTSAFLDWLVDDQRQQLAVAPVGRWSTALSIVTDWAESFEGRVAEFYKNKLLQLRSILNDGNRLTRLQKVKEYSSVP